MGANGAYPSWPAQAGHPRLALLPRVHVVPVRRQIVATGIRRRDGRSAAAAKAPVDTAASVPDDL
jgi:hypothetical protein